MFGPFARSCGSAPVLGSLPQHFLQAVSAADNLGNPLHIGSNCPDLVFAQLSDGNAAKENTVELLFVCMHRSKLADSELVVKDDSDQRGIVATALLNN